MIPHNRPTLNNIDSAAVAKVIDSGYIAQAQNVEAFEKMVSSFCGLHYGVALSSGTAALFVALKIAGVKSGCKVIIPTYVCSALLNAIYMAGGTPVLVDVYREDFNANWGEVISKIDSNTKAVIIPHIHGIPAEIFPKQLPEWVTLIEDCATALNSFVKEDKNRVHVGHKGRMAVFSFYATKYLTTGQGGMICTDDCDIYKKVLDYREFDCCEEYHPRFNLQMTDMQAALGISQMHRIDDFTARRKTISDAYKDVCNKKGFAWQAKYHNGITPNNYRFIIRLEEEKRDLLKMKMDAAGIRCIIPIETYELLHNYLKYPTYQFEVAEMIAKSTLSLPIYPLLDDENLNEIVNVLENF